LEIPEIIASAMEAISYVPDPSVSDILATQQSVDEWIESRW
jgi:hypothetical protein